MMNPLEIHNKTIGQRISKERKKFGLSRERFAEIINLSDYYVGQLERGERQMSLPTLIKVTDCLHVSLDYLIFGKIIPENNCLFDVHNTYGSDENKDSHLTEINELLHKCSPKELELVKNLLKTLLPYLGN
ncbi:MAG: helix-turn-helix domain-containing protein [Clostridia bacterium]|nr:helix-turn-helix domain-containing protein [Clostridia bacterium]MDD4048775.1 helix-turn-helix domain-containing protein [Clostridia bacterium]